MRRVLLPTFLVLATCSRPPQREELPPRPLVVVEVKPGSAAERSGLAAEDRVISWRREGASGAIGTPFDLIWLEIEHLPRAPVTLVGQRGAEPREWLMAPGRWDAAARPELGAQELALFRRGREALAAGDTTTALDAFQAGAAQAMTAGDGLAAAWWHASLAAALTAPDQAAPAKASFAAAVAASEPLGDPTTTALLLRAQASHLDDLEEVAPAEALLARAFALEDALEPPPLARAGTLLLHASVVGQRERYAEARDLLSRAQGILEAEAPESLALAGVLRRLGIVAYRSGQLELADDRLRRAAALLERLDPGGREHGLAVSNLGILQRMRGDLEASENAYRRAWEIAERFSPGGRDTIGPMGNLGTVLIERGDLAGAEELFRSALEIAERTEPENNGRAILLINLGNIAQNRGDLDRAEQFLRRALAILERQAPEGQLLSQTLSNLGTVLMERKAYGPARNLFERALKLERQPGRGRDGSALGNLGKLEIESGGDLRRAADYLAQALTIFRQSSPEGIHHSDVLISQAELADRRGDHPAAADLASQALGMRSRYARGSFKHAEALHHLGAAKLAAGALDEGAEHLCQAVAVLDQQRRRLGGGDGSRLAFEAIVSRFYTACLGARLRQNRPEEAFFVAERGRARAFLSLLAERDLRYAELPAELAARRHRLDREAERLAADLASSEVAASSPEHEKLLAREAELLSERQALGAELRQKSARLVELEQPEPLDLAGVRAALDPGTFLLSYSVAERTTRLFVVAPPEVPGPGLETFELGLGGDRLRQRIELYRRQLVLPGGSGRGALKTSHSQLYSLLLGPAEAALAGADRLVLLPDGPLHGLPWAALLAQGSPALAAKPVHHVLSATVYAELLRQRPEKPRVLGSLVAFGDPRYGSEKGAGLTPAALRWGQRLEPLPGARREVETIAALFPDTKVFLGDEAREETVMREAPAASHLHFACHAWIDEREPLSSALALSPATPGATGGHDGRLEVWEIFERLRLAADLVTLSACDSALGKEMGGEGLVGLTRAFQFAGARSVLASLWRVPDEATGELMRRFYGYLSQGLPKDEALRRAQQDLARSADPVLAHPQSWAAFQLYGDWH